MKRYLLFIILTSLFVAGCGASNAVRLEETPKPDPTQPTILSDAEIDMIDQIDSVYAPALKTELDAIQRCVDDFTIDLLSDICDYHLDVVNGWNNSTDGKLVGGNILGLEQLVERTANDLKQTLIAMVDITEGGGEAAAERGAQAYNDALTSYDMLMTELTRLEGMLAGAEEVDYQ